MEKKIVVRFETDGSTSLETKGFQGEECRKASAFLEEALGKKTSEELTLEFFAHKAESRQAVRRGGE